MTKIISIGNQKGGVGKTTTTFNLAYELASRNKKVLVIDLDMQGNLTNLFGIQNTKRLTNTISNLFDLLLNDQDIDEEDVNLINKFEIDLLPANKNLAITESRLKTEMGTDKMLDEIISFVNMNDKYDYILLDLSPSFNTLSMNALTCSDSIIIPMNAELLSVFGLNDFLQNVDKVKKRLNRKLQVEGILLTMVDNRLNLTKIIKENINISFGYKFKIFQNEIPKTTIVGKSELEGLPLSLYDKNHKVSKSYRNLVNEFINK